MLLAAVLSSNRVGNRLSSVFQSLIGRAHSVTGIFLRRTKGEPSCQCGGGDLICHDMAKLSAYLLSAHFISRKGPAHQEVIRQRDVSDR
jgi:hypothetical protein